nr:RecName: Full=Alpha-conotoxin LvIC; Flags: Precursor [Conus lividus]
SNGRNAAAGDKPSYWITLAITDCCANPVCNGKHCQGRR